MRIRKGNKMILTTSTDGCVIIVEVDADRKWGEGVSSQRFDVKEKCCEWII